MADWGSGVSAGYIAGPARDVCILAIIQDSMVQLSVSVGNGCPHNVLWYH